MLNCSLGTFFAQLKVVQVLTDNYCANIFYGFKQKMWSLQHFLQSECLNQKFLKSIFSNRCIYYSSLFMVHCRPLLLIIVFSVPSVDGK